MHNKRIFLIHATSVSMAPINEAFVRLWPEVQVFNLLEDSLASDLAAEGHISPAMVQRFVDLSLYVQKSNADAVMFTCSAFGAAIDTCKRVLSIPVLKPNEAMIEKALVAGSKIAIMATFEPTIRSMEEEFYRCAKSFCKDIELISFTCPDAFTALQAGDVQEHNDLIAKTVGQVSDVDVLCFAQFSMTSALGQSELVSTAPILTTPDSAVLKLQNILSR